MAEPSRPTETLLTPGKVTDPQEVPCGETIPMTFPLCGSRAYALPPRTGTKSATLPSHGGAARNADSPGSTDPAQRPSELHRYASAEQRAGGDGAPVPTANDCPAVRIARSTQSPLIVVPDPVTRAHALASSLPRVA